MAQLFQIPIALSKDTNKLVNVKDVPLGLNCNCYCGECKENLIAVNQEIKQKPHFRHAKNSKCKFIFNFETYIHWLTKEIFKNINSMSLPQIKLGDLDPVTQKHFNKKRLEFLKTNKILSKIKNLDENLIQPKAIMLQNVERIEIEKFLTETVYDSKYGSVKPDIILYSKNEILFVDPYLTSKIDDFKLRKIADLDISTISIDLSGFLINHQTFFTLQEFTNFLCNDYLNKKWVHIRIPKVQRLMKHLLNIAWPKRVEAFESLILQNESIYSKLDVISKKIIKLNEEQYDLNKGLKEINFVTFYDI
jgi:hypothetical protein